MKDALNQLKDRFSNPLIFSFLCSWLIANWKITVALLWYDPKQIKLKGANSIFEFISARIEPWKCFWLPLFIAICYTVFIPIIRNFIKAFHSWASKWGENWSLSISKGGQIPIDKYFKLRDEYIQRTKVLEEHIGSERELSDKYNSSLDELSELQNKLTLTQSDLIEKSKFANALNDVKILDGYWTCTYKSTRNPEHKVEILIQDGKYYNIERFSKEVLAFRITNFYFDSRRRTMIFIKEEERSNASIKGLYFVNVLRYDREGVLVGTEDGDVKIEYEKKKDNVLNTENQI